MRVRNPSHGKDTMMKTANMVIGMLGLEHPATIWIEEQLSKHPNATDEQKNELSLCVLSLLDIMAEIEATD